MEVQMSQNSLPVKRLFRQLHLQRGLVFGVIIMSALIAFEIFNYSTTEFALTDLLGNLRFAGIHWATILDIAFCGIDFAGIARLFTPSISSQSSAPGPHETWYLFGAWLLAASMNAMLTWWGVSLAVLGHQTLGNAMLGRTTLLRVVPIFVALMVWLIRVLIIGTFSVAGENLFSQGAQANNTYYKPVRPGYGGNVRPSLPQNSTQAQFNRSMSAMGSSAFGRKPVPPSRPEEADEPPEPTYHPLSATTSQIDKITETRRNSTHSRHF
jgi:hypothetical protein